MMTNLAFAKNTVQKFFSLLNAGQYDAAFSAVSPDVVWWVPGNLPFSGNKTKSEYMGIVQQIQRGFPEGLTLNVVAMIAEGNKVAAEVVSHGVHVNGKTYQNKYHFLFELQGDVITHVKEYMDTLHLYQLIAPAK
jgi:ketosteroid isomerase-like protein